MGFNVVTDTAAWGQEESGLVKTLAVQDNTWSVIPRLSTELLHKGHKSFGV